MNALIHKYKTAFCKDWRGLRNNLLNITLYNLWNSFFKLQLQNCLFQTSFFKFYLLSPVSALFLPICSTFSIFATSPPHNFQDYNPFQIIGTTRKVVLENLQFKLSRWDLLSKCACISIVYIHEAYGSIEKIEKKIFYKKWFFFTLQILATFWSWRA